MFLELTSPYSPALTSVSYNHAFHRSRKAKSHSFIAGGYFNAYGNAARKDNHDYVVHLGDYIYEYGGGDERAHSPPHLIFSLHDYRTRHGQVRKDSTNTKKGRHLLLIMVFNSTAVIPTSSFLHRTSPGSLPGTTTVRVA